MLSRRLLRIKVMQILYAYFQRDNDDLQLSEKELFQSIFKAYQLYHYLLLLILDIRNYATNKIEIAKNKFQPTDKDLNPSKRFTNNRILIQIEQNKQLKKFLNDYKFSWVNYPELIKKIFNKLSVPRSFSNMQMKKNPATKKINKL